MAKAKTANKSKPAKKTVHKTFHKQAIAEVTNPIAQETTPQTTEQANEISLPQETEPEDVTPEVTQSSEEINLPITAQTASETTENTIEISSEKTAEDTPNSELIPTTEESQEQTHPTESLLADPNEGKNKPLILGLIIIVLITASISAYYFYTKKQQTPPTTQTSQASPKPSPQALNKADWTLEVLNGSGKKGAAAALADKLTAKGYQIIKTGNAPEDVTTSQVFFAEKTKDQADLFLEDIKTDLSNPTNAGTLNDSTASARIIIGTE